MTTIKIEFLGCQDSRRIGTWKQSALLNFPTANKWKQLQFIVQLWRNVHLVTAAPRLLKEEITYQMAASKTYVLFERICKTSTTTNQKYWSVFLCRHLITPPSPMQVKNRLSSLIGAHIQGKLGIFKNIPLAPAKPFIMQYREYFV